MGSTVGKGASLLESLPQPESACGHARSRLCWILPGAKDPFEIEKILGLGSELGPGHLWHVQPACAIIGDGLEEGLEILYEMILKRRRQLKQAKKKYT
ncbi:ADP-ribosylation factor-like protein 4A [Caerostris extrusa]|uniref:ADP-ribosylation factor-like protein 4A n=1 Tax=Caerostris extrusa TaxID=172846 RepID=A0AAV4QU88_CAEEX|nr:ADP-ribosylation factor-like protein 4A [Caerostris extrusa]